LGENGLRTGLCFWTDAPYKVVQDLTNRAGLDVPFTIATDSPQGALILAMGGDRVGALQVRGLVPKNRKLESLRGSLIQTQTGPTMVTYSPGIIKVDPEKLAQIIWDIRLAARYVKTGSLKPEVGDYHWADDLSDFIEAVEAQYARTGRPVEVGLDTETENLFPFYPDKNILTVQVSMRPGTATAVVVQTMSPTLLRQFREQVRWLLTTPMVKLRGANLNYDLLWIWEKWGIRCTNFTMDTCVVGSLLNENESHGLKWHARQYTPCGGYETDFEARYDKGHLSVVPWKQDPDALTYVGGDADLVLRVADNFKSELARTDEGRFLSRLYVTIVHPALGAFLAIEKRGMLIDRQKFNLLEQEILSFLATREREMVRLLSPRMRAKYAETIEDRLKEGKEPLTPAMLGTHFFDPTYGMGFKPKMLSPKTQKPSTAFEHISMYFDRPEAKEFGTIMKECKSARKTLSTFVRGFLKHLRPDGRFHPSFMLFHGDAFETGEAEDETGTVTGRLTAKSPPVQVIPKSTTWAKKIRDCYIPERGRLMWGADYAQGELKLVACIAQERTMIEVYTPGTPLNLKTGGDLHAMTGSAFAEMSISEFLQKKESDPEFFARYRQYGKHGNFGMLYGISPAGFQAYAWRKGISLTIKQAEQYLDNFFDLYKGLRQYHADQKRFVHQHKYVISPLGRIRHLPQIESPNYAMVGLAERQGINAPIQSSLSDFCIWAAAMIEEELGDDAGLCCMVHDQLVGTVEEEKAEVVLPRVKFLMENLPYGDVFGFFPALQLTVDVEIGPSLGRLAKWEV